MAFKLTALISFCIFLCACQKKAQWVDTAKYHCLVAINNVNTVQGILVSTPEDSLIALGTERVTSDGIYWTLIFSHFSKKTQDLVLHRYPGQPSYAKYYSFCCMPEPDQPEYTYSIWEPDSLNNFLHVDVDTSSKYLSGNFRATFVNIGYPYDTIRMRCNTLSCSWE